MARLAIACPEGDVVMLLSTLTLWQVVTKEYNSTEEQHG